MTPGFSSPDDRDAAMAAPAGVAAPAGMATAAGVEARAQGADTPGAGLEVFGLPSANSRPSTSSAAGNVAPSLPDLQRLEAEARRRGLLLRLQVGRPLGLLWSLRVAVARREPPGPGAAAGILLLLGEIKGWAWPAPEGLRLDTMRVRPQDSSGVGPLLSAAAFAWSLEASPCRIAHILAIRDVEQQHRRLVRYFRGLGFAPLRELGSAPGDWAPRLLWGGSGLLMEGDCGDTIRRCARRWRST